MYKVLITCCLFVLIHMSDSRCVGEEASLLAKVSTLEGTAITGEILEWTTESVTLKQHTASRKIPAKELLKIEFVSTATSATSAEMVLELVDGSRIPLTSFTVAARIATVETPFSPEPVAIPTDKIRYVSFPASETSLESWLPDWKKQEFPSDVLVLVKKQSSEVEFLTGIIHDVSSAEVNFNWEGDAIAVKRAKVAGISYFHARQEESTDPVCRLNLGQEYRLFVASLEQGPAGLQLTTTLGLQFQVGYSQIESADYSAGKIVYLSDLEPTREVWTPLIELPTSDPRVELLGMPRRDRSFEGSLLKLSWPAEKEETITRLEVYPKGLALRSRTEVEYRLPKGIRRFVAVAGIDPETQVQGTVSFTISADGETLLQCTVAGKDPPLPIDLEISGKQKLEILVDYGDNLDLGDRLHLVEARLVK